MRMLPGRLCWTATPTIAPLAQVREERSAEVAALAVRKYMDALCVYLW